jgi:hypothetical protein
VSQILAAILRRNHVARRLSDSPKGVTRSWRAVRNTSFEETPSRLDGIVNDRFSLRLSAQVGRGRLPFPELAALPGLDHNDDVGSRERHVRSEACSFRYSFPCQGTVNVPAVLCRGIPVDSYGRRCRRLGEVVESSSGCSLLPKAEPGLLGGCPDIADS